MLDTQNESFVFYKSFLNAIECLPKENQLYAYQYITKYALQGIEPEQNEDPISYAIFLMAKPQIDANIGRRINGNKGGAKPGNQNARKNWNTVDNGEKQLKQPMVDLENDGKQPMVDLENDGKQPNVNVNVNVNDNVNVKENVKRKFLDYVYLSDEEYKKISDRYGERVLKEFITRLNNWIGEKPKSKDRKDRNAYYTILSWIRKDGIKELPPKPPDNETGIYDLPF